MNKTRLALSTLVLAYACAPAPQPPREPETTVRAPDVVFVPTPFRVVDAMLAVSGVGPGDVLYDLGSGDGRIVIAAAKRFGIKAIGIDIDPKRIEESNFNADTAGVRHLVEFRNADLFATDLRPASVITLYLLPALNVRLRPKLFEELRPGSRVVSNSFDMGDWKADSILTVDARVVYYWVMPAGIAGTWDIVMATQSGERTHEVQFEQQYQAITAARSSGGSAIRNARVRGDTVRFDIVGGATGASAATRFEGTVAGSTMSGTWSSAGISGSWRASRRD